MDASDEIFLSVKTEKTPSRHHLKLSHKTLLQKIKSLQSPLKRDDLEKESINSPQISLNLSEKQFSIFPAGIFDFSSNKNKQCPKTPTRPKVKHKTAKTTTKAKKHFIRFQKKKSIDLNLACNIFHHYINIKTLKSILISSYTITYIIKNLINLKKQFFLIK